MEPEVKESLKIRLGESINGKRQCSEPRAGLGEPIDRRPSEEQQQQTDHVQSTVSRVILKMIRKHEDPMSYDIVNTNDNRPQYRVEEKQETTTSTIVVKAKQQEVKQEPVSDPTSNREELDTGATNNVPNDIEQLGDKEMMEEEDEEEDEEEAEEEDEEEVEAEAETEDVEMKPATEDDKEKDSTQEETPSSLGRNRRVRQKNRYFLDFHCIDLTKGARSNKDDYDTYTTAIRSSNRRSTTDSRGQLEETTPETFESRYCRKCSAKTARDLDGECQACLYKKIVESSSRRRGGGSTSQKSSTSASQRNRSSNAKQQQRQKQVNNTTNETTSKATLASSSSSSSNNNNNNNNNNNSNNRRKATKQSSSKGSNNNINSSPNVVASSLVLDQSATINIAATNSPSTTNAVATNTSPSSNEIKNELVTNCSGICTTTNPIVNTNGVLTTTSVSPPNESINQDSSSSRSSSSGSSSCNNSIISNDESNSKLPKLDSWSPEEVAEYITSKGFVDEAELFKLQSVDGIALLLMQRTDFTYGLKIKLGPALKIYDQVCKLKREYFQTITI